MAVLRPVVDEQQHPGGGEALDQAVEEDLRRVVGPVEILEHQQQGLHLALPEEQGLDRVDGSLLPRGGVQLSPCRVLDRDLQQRLEGGERGAQGLVEREQPADELLADGSRVVPVVDRNTPGSSIEAASWFADRERRRWTQDGQLPVRCDRGDLPEPAATCRLRPLRPGPRLAVPVSGLLHRLAQQSQLGLAASDEPGQSPGDGYLETSSRRRRADQLEHLHRLREAADGDGPEGPRLDIALGESQGLGGQQDRGRLGHLLHPGGQVCGLADRGVLHLQVAPDGPDHDLSGVEADADLDG
jgi:hypothetical protein